MRGELAAKVVGLVVLVLAVPFALDAQLRSDRQNVSARPGQEPRDQCEQVRRGGGQCAEEELGDTPSGPIDGTNTKFALARTPQSPVDLFRNGQKMSRDSYSVNGNVILFDGRHTPQPGDVLQAFYKSPRLGFAEQSVSIIGDAAVLGLSLDPQFTYASRRAFAHRGQTAGGATGLVTDETKSPSASVVSSSASDTLSSSSATSDSAGVRALLLRLRGTAAENSALASRGPKGGTRMTNEESPAGASTPARTLQVAAPTNGVSIQDAYDVTSHDIMSEGARKLLEILRKPAQIVTGREKDH